MCLLCAGIFRPSAHLTLLAAFPDRVKAAEYLHTQGFSGLTFEDFPEDDWVRFTYKDYNPLILDKNFGPRKKATKGRVQWVVPQGGLYVNEARKRVLIHEPTALAKRPVKEALSKTDVKPLDPQIDRKPATDLGDAMELAYKKAQASGSDGARKTFMKSMFAAFNGKKFGGKLHDNIYFMVFPETGELAHVRGVWRADLRQLGMGARVWNARYCVFAETFLHEMCHVAVTQIDKVHNGGHGAEWEAWMLKVGLKPKLYADFAEEEYMTAPERKAHEAEKAKKEKALQGEKPLEVPSSFDLTGIIPARYVKQDGTALDGFLYQEYGFRSKYHFMADSRMKMGVNGTIDIEPSWKPGGSDKYERAKFYERKVPPTAVQEATMKKIFDKANKDK